MSAAMLAAAKPAPKTQKTLSQKILPVLIFLPLCSLLLYVTTLLPSHPLHPLTAITSHPSDLDLLLSSFPKSGNFYIRFLLAHIAAGLTVTGDTGDGPINFSTIESLLPDLELGSIRHPATFHAIAGGYDNATRVFKSHQPYHSRDDWRTVGVGEREQPDCSVFVGSGVEQYQCYCPNCPGRYRRIVLLVRDPRSTICSYFHQQVGLGVFVGKSSFGDFLKSDASKYGVGWEEWYDSFRKNDNVVVVGSTSAHRAEATKRGTVGVNDTQVYLVRYEDVMSDPVASLRGLVHFIYPTSESELGLTAIIAIIEKAVAASSFDKMRAVEESDSTMFDKFHKGKEDSFRVVRKGKTDGWRECFRDAEDDGRAWTEEKREVMEWYGYEV